MVSTMDLVTNQDTQSKSDKEIQTTSRFFEEYLFKLFGSDQNYSELSLCTICMEPWAADTDHRIVSLKCGHLFGESCLKEWMKKCKSEQAGQRCPNCETPFRRPDIRTHYAKTILALDKSEETLLEEEARKEASLNSLSLIERNNLCTNMKLFYNQLQGFKIQRKALLSKIERLKAIKEARQASTSSPFEPSSANILGYAMGCAMGSDLSSSNVASTAAAAYPDVRTSLNNPCGIFKRIYDVELMAKGDCRLIASSENHSLLVCTQKSNIELYEGYGLRTIGYGEFRPKMFIPIHRAQIKDIAFHPTEATILSASLDKTIKHTNVHHGSVIANFALEDGAWSCCWNESDPLRFLVGLKNSRVLEFDLRYPQCPINELKTPEKLPVTSLSYVNNLALKGVICTQLRGSEFYAHKSADLYDRYMLPVQGNFTSGYFNSSTSQLLLSSRPRNRDSHISHIVYNLQITENETDKSYAFSCIPGIEYEGGFKADLLLKSKLFPHPTGTGHLVCAGDQDTNGFIVWDSNSTFPTMKTNCGSPVFDLSLIKHASEPHLICLTESKLFVSKWFL